MWLTQKDGCTRVQVVDFDGGRRSRARDVFEGAVDQELEDNIQTILAGQQPFFIRPQVKLSPVLFRLTCVPLPLMSVEC